VKKKTLALGVAGTLAIAGGGAAIAASKGDSRSEDSRAIVNDVAKQLGVEPSALTQAFKNALKNRVDAAVAAGRLTKEQGDELKARIDSGGLPFFGFGRAGGLHHHGLSHLLGLDAAADYIGITEAQLHEDLESGKTLAQVAKDHGKSVSGLVDAMVKDAKSRLDRAVADGRITRAKADEILGDLKERITDRVNGEAPSFRGFHRFDRFRGPSF
jgi:hypothetical protein